MQILSKSQILQLRFLIQGKSYKNIHASLVENLSADDSVLFAKIDMSSREAIWYVDNRELNYRSFVQAVPEERELIAEKLEEKRPRIVEQVRSNPQIADIAEQLFYIPSEECIFFAMLPNGDISVTLTQWGILHKGALGEIDPISAVIHLPRNVKAEVFVQAVYKGGGIAVGVSLSVLFFEIPKSYTTNEEGIVALGKLPIGRSIAVTCEGETKYFTVVEEPSQFIIITLPRFTSAHIDVVNQLNEPIVGIILSVNDICYTADEKGSVDVRQFEFIEGEMLRVTLLSVEGSERMFSLQWNEAGNRFIYVVREKFDCSLQISVVNEKGSLIADYPVEVLVDGVNDTFRTDRRGMIERTPIDYENHVLVRDGNNSNNRVEMTIDKGNNRCELCIETPPPSPPLPSPSPEKIVRVQLYNIDDSPMMGITIKVITEKGELECITDDKGYIYLPVSHFKDGEKVVTKFMY